MDSYGRLIFEDSLCQNLGPGWSWIREDPDAWEVTPHGLRLRTLPGTLWGEANNARNILLRPSLASEEGLSSVVTVTNHPVRHGEQAGLIWYHDDGNYVKLVKEALDEQTWIVMAREEDDQPELIDKQPVATETAELRLRRVGEHMIGEFRTANDAPWQQVGVCTVVDRPGLRPGIFTHGGPEDAERWVTLSDFRIAIL